MQIIKKEADFLGRFNPWGIHLSQQKHQIDVTSIPPNAWVGSSRIDGSASATEALQQREWFGG